MAVSQLFGHSFDDIFPGCWDFPLAVDTAQRDLASMATLLARSLGATIRILRMGRISTQQLLPPTGLTETGARNTFYRRRVLQSITRRWRQQSESCAQSSLTWKIHPPLRDEHKEPEEVLDITITLFFKQIQTMYIR